MSVPAPTTADERAAHAEGDCPDGASPAASGPAARTASEVASEVAPQVVDGVRLGLPVSVRTPATSANLGPGFDSLGLALALYDEIDVVATGDGGVDVIVEGEGAGAVPGDERHLVVRAIRAGLEYAGAGRPGLRLRCRNAIPHGRGLGSSASAVVAGLVAARGLLADPAPLDDATLLRLATAFEGHPDNAAAALLGGFTISWSETAPGSSDGAPTDSAGDAVQEAPDAAVSASTDRRAPRIAVAGADGTKAPAAVAGELPQARAVAVPVHPDVSVVACVPGWELPTSVARRMLPAEVPHRDAAFNAGRAALLVEALSRRPDLLPAATADRLHQNQRASAMPDSARLVRRLRAAGAAAVVSGAGPTVLVLGAGEAARRTVEQVLGESAGAGVAGWRALSLAIDTLGARLVTHRMDLG
jgi:homoserine kinase